MVSPLVCFVRGAVRNEELTLMLMGELASSALGSMLSCWCSLSDISKGDMYGECGNGKDGGRREKSEEWPFCFATFESG